LISTCWTALPHRYDDGGFSDGAMDRPALLRLLEDVRSGRVDAVLVYKVDRLTRAQSVRWLANATGRPRRPLLATQHSIRRRNTTLDRIEAIDKLVEASLELPADD
jgi:Resolvase, N terminal domain